MTDDSIQASDGPGEPSAISYMLPFILYMAIASRTPSLGPGSVDDVAVNSYFYLVVIQVLVALAVVLFFGKRYLKEFPFRIDIWGFVVGIVGVFLWVGICSVGLEARLLQSIGLGNWVPERVGFDPFTQISNPARRSIFLFFRFTLLAAMVPIVEELFLRGWFVRWCKDVDWYKVKLSAVGWPGIIGVALYGLATHPGEAFAAVTWFTLVTLLMIKTGKFWNCVVAHAVTNLLLGLYVVYYSQWHFW